MVTLYVNDAAASGGDGLSWATAYDNLQSALEGAAAFNSDGTAENDVAAIWIAGGTYIPTAPREAGKPRTASFSLVDKVALYGGFAGTEASLEERNADLTMYETVLSGDLGVPGDNVDDSLSVVFCGPGIESTLDGLTITNGAGDSDLAAVYIEGTLAVVDSSVCGNAASGLRNKGTLVMSTSRISENGGAGIWNGGVLEVTGSTVAGNGFTTQAVQGGIHNTGTATVADSHLLGNTASIGAGIANWDGTFSLINCVLSENAATFRGGGISNESNFATAAMTVHDCVLVGNSASNDAEGGGVFNTGVLHMSNSVVSGNAADTDGGGIFTVGTLTVVNSTIVANIAHGNGGGICHFTDGAVTTLNNTIVAGNVASRGNDLYHEDGEVRGVHNLIGDGSNQTAFLDGGNGNKVGSASTPIDPRFVRVPSPGGDGVWGTQDDDYGDLRLRLDSPAVDAGANALALDAEGQTLVTDLDGGIRVRNGTVDIGAYESPPPIPGDLNLDGVVGGDDLDIVRTFWGQSVPAGSIAHGDPSGDGMVTTDDLDIVRANWGATAQAAAVDAVFRRMVAGRSAEETNSPYGPIRPDAPREGVSANAKRRLRAAAAEGWLQELARLSNRREAREPV